jgi:hypothetical protein
MKLISFDVGIKNMAYCIFDIQTISSISDENKCNSNISVLDWNVINLMNDEPEVVKCNCIITPIKKNTKTKKKNIKKNNEIDIELQSPIPIQYCNKIAKYQKSTSFFCEKHAKTSGFLIPNKECSPNQLKKRKIEELFEIISKYTIPIIEENLDINLNVNVNIKPKPIKKKDILEKVLDFFEKKSLIPIIHIKKSANDLDLISIGKNLKKELNKIEEMKTVTHVIIENQISPIANRMKTIQGMLAQYFIMNTPTNTNNINDITNDISIEFLSSSGKLKGFEKQNENISSEYKQHKKDAIYYCHSFLENEKFSSWKSHILHHKKKDDLADCFLQGIWYLQNNKNNNIHCV